MSLAESYASGPTEPAVRELTIGELLQDGAAAVPDRLALITGTTDPARQRSWTYTELYDESVRAAYAFRTRRHLGTQHTGMDTDRVRQRYGRSRTGHGEPYFPGR